MGNYQCPECDSRRFAQTTTQYEYVNADDNGEPESIEVESVEVEQIICSECGEKVQS